MTERATPPHAMLGFMLPWPPSQNHYWRNDRGRTHISTEGKAYRESASYEMIVQRVPRLRLAVPLGISLRFHPPERDRLGRLRGNRIWDAHNYHKALLDVLEHYGLVENDHWFDDTRLIRALPTVGGAVLVEIRALQEHERRR